MSTVLVTGAAGSLGRLVVRELNAAGHDVRALIHRSTLEAPGVEARPGDLVSGEGLAAAVEGVDAVIHGATSPIRPTSVDVQGTERLLRALESGAPSAHLVYISIVGVDDHPYYYYRAKAGAERLIAASGLPWTIQRATQFHELTVRFLAPFDRLPFALVLGGIRFQPMAATEAARRLVEQVGAGPSGRVPDISGPEVHPMEELGRSYRQAIGRPARVIGVPLVGRAGAAFKEERHILKEPRYGGQTWQEFLAERYPRPAV
jgi:uncharacterized protein YbjT (DUF2867 family)